MDYHFIPVLLRWRLGQWRMVQSKIDQLTSENTSLRGQISQAEQNAYLINALCAKAPQAAYVVANPYTGTAYAGYGCGATSACGCGV